MSQALVDAIDHLLTFVGLDEKVHSHRDLIDGSKERAEFDELDLEIYLLASKSGLPLPNAAAPSEHFSNIGKLNIQCSYYMHQCGPGLVGIPGTGPGVTLVPSERWATDMRALRALAREQQEQCSNYQTAAKFLMPNYRSESDDHMIAAIVFMHTGLQPESFAKLSFDARIPFIKMAESLSEGLSVSTDDVGGSQTEVVVPLTKKQFETLLHTSNISFGSLLKYKDLELPHIKPYDGGIKKWDYVQTRDRIVEYRAELAHHLPESVEEMKKVIFRSQNKNV